MNTYFRYEARSPSGRLERGALQALDQADALQRLYQRNLTPIALHSNKAGTSASTLSDKSAHELARTLAQLLRAGLAFAQALRFASDELSPTAAAVAARMRENAELGDPISEALDEFEGPEARLLKGVIKAGETSGRLADALEMAAIAFGRSAALRARMASAMIYPSFVIAATLATLACFLLLVVPTMAQAFAGAEDRLPQSTRDLLAFSHWLQTDGPLAGFGLVVLIGAIAASADIRAVLGRFLDALLASPAALGISPRLEFASFAGLAALSLEAGVPSAAAFDAAAAGVRNTEVRQKLLSAVAAIRSGERPSQALDRFSAPPKSFVRLMLVGEETGRLGEALKQASALLATEAEQRLERLGAIAGPIVTLTLGGLVASVVMSLFLGLLAMSDMATA